MSTNFEKNRVPTNPFSRDYSSLIRPIKIYLPFEQGEKEKNDDYDNFVGRERLMEKLYYWLSDDKKESGSYLVTGFRGMGKTSLVKRVIDRMTRDISEKHELFLMTSCVAWVVGVGIIFMRILLKDVLPTQICKCIPWWLSGILILISLGVLFWNEYWILGKKNCGKQLGKEGCLKYKKEEDKKVKEYPCPNEKKEKDLSLVERMVRRNGQDNRNKEYSRIRISINLGHEVLHERDVLGLIATQVRDSYKRFVDSISPRPWRHFLLRVLPCSVISGFLLVWGYVSWDCPQTYFSHYLVSKAPALNNDPWFSRLMWNIWHFLSQLYNNIPSLSLVLIYLLVFLLVWKIGGFLTRYIPSLSNPQQSLRRLNVLTERIVATTDIESGFASSVDKKIINLSLINHRKRKTIPIADIREIETELADIINQINSDNCLKTYQAKFIVVFDELDKIDPAMVKRSDGLVKPEFTDSVKGFPGGMDSRERRRSVLKLLANIKLFVSTAMAKFIFISGRELYDAFLADLSDRDFAISSIFSGVINVDSFLTPEGGQTDVRSMSEWYIANRLIPRDWLEKREKLGAKGLQNNYKDQKNEREIDRLFNKFHNEKEDSFFSVLKEEIPSLRWYYEYLIKTCGNDRQEAAYVIGFLHTFAAYLTHISNGSPKKIFLYFDKFIRRDTDCKPMNDWGDTCIVGQHEKYVKSDNDKQLVLYFDPIQQKTINFVHFLANPIMGTITNDMSDYGDRFLVSLSFIIDHIYKHHSRSFSWRNLEQIPELHKTSKAPELRDSVMSIMEFLTQTHISPILIGLNEYKFHKSISEEISMMSKMNDETSALFNFTLDESLSIIEHNTRMLNYYMELDKAARQTDADSKQYLPIIARIHSNLGDLHFWDEDYYSAALEYRAAADTFEGDETKAGFLTRIRCLLKLGLTYELRKFYPNAYQIYCQLMSILIERRWIDDALYGLTTISTYTDDWRGKRQAMVHNQYGVSHTGKVFYNQFGEEAKEIGDFKTDYGVNVDGVISSFARDLTPEKSRQISSLSLFEEIRYVYQAILAKLSILEKTGMSGITQTNIDVAEGEFLSIHKSVNIREKFLIAADFFRKLAEILYYKNSLTILTQNQDSLYASVYYDDYDLLFNLDEYCLSHKYDSSFNALAVKHDVRVFFNEVGNPASDNKENALRYRDGRDCTYGELFEDLQKMLKKNLEWPGIDTSRVKGYLEYSRKHYVSLHLKRRFYHCSVEQCDYHSHKLRQQGLRPPCYACKYYTRSLRILAGNMFVGTLDEVLGSPLSKSYGILKRTFKKDLLYTGSTHARALAETLEGFGNVMLSCASGNDYEEKGSMHGLSHEIIHFLRELCSKQSEDAEREYIWSQEKELSGIGSLSRLDKCILYYWDAYRIYMFDDCYNEAVGCLNKIINVIVYYMEVLCYYGHNDKLQWCDNEKTVAELIGDRHFNDSFVVEVFKLIARYTGYQYDLSNLSEINELKWIYSLEIKDNLDLTRLSLYPTIRGAWLRIVEIRAKGLRYLAKRWYFGYEKEDYRCFIAATYPRIAPQRRYETTFYEEVLGYYTKMRYNDHILNDILGGNVLFDAEKRYYSNTYHITFYKKLGNYLAMGCPESSFGLDASFLASDNTPDSRLDLVEFLIHDSLVCVTSMIRFFTPHNHLTSFSKSFVGLVYNFFWEWSRKYECLNNLYQYKDDVGSQEKILGKMTRIGSLRDENRSDRQQELQRAMNDCCVWINSDNDSVRNKFGPRSVRFYERLRHDIDDITLEKIYSNFSAEMALKYYRMAIEANTEGEAYREMIGSLQFLNDDLNNDTCQFNIALDRFLLNSGLVSRQRERLERLYKDSNVYGLKAAYLDTKEPEPNFDNSLYINSEY